MQSVYIVTIDLNLSYTFYKSMIVIFMKNNKYYQENKNISFLYV